MTEAHWFKFAIHPRNAKMYQDMKHQYWWKGLKIDVASFVTKCVICQQVKMEHPQRPSGLLQPLEILDWKGDKITMDFVTELRTLYKNNVIWVIVDQLTKSAHFLLFMTDFPVIKLSKLYIKEVIKLHRVSSSIVSNRDPLFTSRFQISLQRTLGREWILAPLIILRQMGDLRGPFRPQRTCCDVWFLILVVTRMSTYRW